MHGQNDQKHLISFDNHSPSLLEKSFHLRRLDVWPGRTNSPAMWDEYHRQLRKIDFAILLVLTLGVLAIAVVTAREQPEQARIVETMRR